MIKIKKHTNEEPTDELLDSITEQRKIQLPEVEEPQYLPLVILDEILVEEFSIDGMCGVY